MQYTLFLVLALSAVALARPSYVQFAQDGASYSYNFQSPAIAYNNIPQPLLARTQFFRTVLPQSSSVVVGPALNYNVQAFPTPVIGVPQGPAFVQTRVSQPANIQLSSDGFVLDTPEVAQAKSEHYARFAAEASRNVAIQQTEQQEIIDDTVEVGSPVVAVRTVVPQQAPVLAVRTIVPQEPANIQVGADGHLLDTPEVAQAKSEHLARFAAESARVGIRTGFVQPINVFENAVPIVRNVEIADVKVGADGHLLDTPAVAQAKAQHFAQYNEEAARAVAAGGDTNDYSDESVVIAGNPIVAANQVFAVRGAFPTVAVRVNDPPADIKVSADGFVLDTPEVASAKANHLATKSAIEATSTYVEPIPVAAPAIAPVPQFIAYTGPSVAYTSAPYAYSAPVVSTAQTKWVGPEANIQVGSDGFLIDTPEVQQARAEHLATRSAVQANSVSGIWAGATARYAAPALSADGQYLLDTPEVASAKAAHFAAYNNEVAKNAAVKTLNYGQLVYSVPTVRTTVAPTVGYPYSSPLYRFLSYRYAPTAAPVALTPDGQYLLDTPEVAAAKADHFAAHVRARGF